MTLAGSSYNVQFMLSGTFSTNDVLELLYARQKRMGFGVQFIDHAAEHPITQAILSQVSGMYERDEMVFAIADVLSGTDVKTFQCIWMGA